MCYFISYREDWNNLNYNFLCLIWNKARNYYVCIWRPTIISIEHLIKELLTKESGDKLESLSVYVFIKTHNPILYDNNDPIWIIGYIIILIIVKNKITVAIIEIV